MGTIETIGRIVRHDGRSFRVLEVLSAERGTFMLEGEQSQPFQSEVAKAIRSGYTLKECADSQLRSIWRRLAEAAGQDDAPADPVQVTSSQVSPAACKASADGQDNKPERSVPDSAASEMAEPDHPEQPRPFPLRDRRGPESPASEHVRLGIAARDREMDHLISKGSGMEITPKHAC